MTPDPTRTVREIAIDNPATVRLFESLGIDYCCGGRRPLSEACELAHVPVTEALRMLTEIGTATSSDEKAWGKVSFHDLVGHITTTHHSYVRQEGPRLEALLDKVISRHGTAHPELLAIRDLFSALNRELVTHMFKEEHILFPFLEKMETAFREGKSLPPACFDSVGTPIARMLADHDDAGELLTKMRALSSGYVAPAGACPSYLGLYHGLQEFERDLHLHVHLENNILFPRAIEMDAALSGAALVDAA